MKKELLQELVKYWDVISFIGNRKLSLLEIETYLKSIDTPVTTCRRYINAIKGSEITLIKYADDFAYL